MLSIIKIKFKVCDVNVFYGEKQVLKNVNIDIVDGSVILFIGLLGCGKFIFLCCFNCMNDMIDEVWVIGLIIMDEEEINDCCLDLVVLCVCVGMVFQKFNLFFKFIFDNVVYGLCIYGLVSICEELEEIVENSLVKVGFWNEVFDCLDDFGISLLGGQ